MTGLKQVGQGFREQYVWAVLNRQQADILTDNKRILAVEFSFLSKINT